MSLINSLLLPQVGHLFTADVNDVTCLRRTSHLVTRGCRPFESMVLTLVPSALIMRRESVVPILGCVLRAKLGRAVFAQVGSTGVVMRSQKEITLKSDLDAKDRLDIYRNFLLYCMSGDVVALPMGSTGESPSYYYYRTPFLPSRKNTYADKLHVKATKILPLVGLARSKQDPINHRHVAQFSNRPPPAGAHWGSIFIDL